MRMTKSVYVSDPTGTQAHNLHFLTAADFIHSSTIGQQVSKKSVPKELPLIGRYG